ncbi:YqzE family protein [Paenibacillus paridis]|uniref:YqzE family protein n=1 Tax=Paenibacillus paridis TaxID=2583376 RepID=UPI00111F75E2|nr:YqzE family protein [Paenibacillus paridis]
MHVYIRILLGNLITSTKGREERIQVAKGEEYVKYMTEQFVAYIETPREERKQTRTSAKARREPWLTRWFGWGPVSIMLWWRGRAERHR